MSVYLPDRGARRWSVEVLSASHPVGLCFLAVLRFVRLTTNRRLFESPLGGGDALDRVPSWLDRPQAVQLAPTPRYRPILSELLRSSHAGADLTTDRTSSRMR